MNKKLIFCCAVCTLGMLQAQAQWNGSSVNTTTTQTNVGIGTDNPSAYLHIAENPDLDGPKLKIEGNFYNPSGFNLPQPNIMEVWNNGTLPSSPYLQMNRFGNVTLGNAQINSENDRLTIFGHLSMVNEDGTARYISARAPKAAFSIVENTNHWNGPSYLMYGKDAEEHQYAGAIRIISYGSSGLGTSIENYDTKEGNFIPRLRVMNDGKVIIGSVPSTPEGYSLYVPQGILTEKVKVALSSSGNWADYVFAPDYKLKSLTEVESFIKANKHLPGVPSGEALAKDGGIDMNEMFAKQMEKIEELTLYMIDMKKEVEQLKKENKELRKAAGK